MPASIDWTSAWMVVERAYPTHPLGVRGDALCGATAPPHPSPDRPGLAMTVRRFAARRSGAWSQTRNARDHRHRSAPATTSSAVTARPDIPQPVLDRPAPGWLEAGGPIADPGDTLTELLEDSSPPTPTPPH